MTPPISPDPKKSSARSSKPSDPKRSIRASSDHGAPLNRPVSRRALTPPADEPLRGYELLICICGGIAAYKTATIVSRLAQAGCGVTVAMTHNAQRFIGELTFRALTGRPVFTSPWESPAAPPSEEYGAIPHLRIAEQADLILVAPATANVLAKVACGLADDIVSDLLIGAAAPAFFAPAMNTRMWNHPAVQRNVQQLREWGYGFIGPDAGWLACRDVGPGRMSEPDAIIAAITTELQNRPRRSTPRSPS